MGLGWPGTEQRDVGVGWRAALPGGEGSLARPEKAQCLRLEAPEKSSVNSLLHSFIHLSDPVKVRNDRQILIGHHPWARISRGLDLLVLHVTFTRTLSGNK